ncbi:MAG: tetratricopeptide repeat protein [Treponema sp.]|jgi:tetratricopeptide (TPR) repeat protein|nr:tetratricopeptide repeat protein [Treponema sp.]
MRKQAYVFIALFAIIFFTSIPHADAQPTANPTAIEQFRRSLEYLMIGDYYNTILTCNQVIRIDPNSAVYYVVRARAYYEMNSFDNAIADCNQALRIDRNNATAYTIRGNSFSKQGNNTRAMQDWRSALNLNPGIEEARNNLDAASQQSN